MSFELFAIICVGGYAALLVLGVFVNAIWGPRVRRRRWSETLSYQDKVRLRDGGGTDYTEDE